MLEVCYTSQCSSHKLGINNTNSRPRNLVLNSLESRLPSRFAFRLPRSSLPWSSKRPLRIESTNLRKQILKICYTIRVSSRKDNGLQYSYVPRLQPLSLVVRLWAQCCGDKVDDLNCSWASQCFGCANLSWFTQLIWSAGVFWDFNWYAQIFVYITLDEWRLFH